MTAIVHVFVAERALKTGFSRCGRRRFCFERSCGAVTNVKSTKSQSKFICIFKLEILIQL